jgi:hypothetical protein
MLYDPKWLIFFLIVIVLLWLEHTLVQREGFSFSIPAFVGKHKEFHKKST